MKRTPTLLANNVPGVLTDSADLDITTVPQGDQMPGRNTSVEDSLVGKFFEGLEQDFRKIFGHE